jgi:hypothetical protein
MSATGGAYEKLVAALLSNQAITASQMFGKACLKIGGKAFVAMHDSTIVFKLSGEAHKKAMSLKNAKLWDPSGKGRPMKEWVALPIAEERMFKSMAKSALAYVAGSK